MKYIKNQFIKSSQENSEVVNFLFAPKFNYEYKGNNLDDFDNYFTDDVLNIEDVNSSLVSIVDKFLSSNTIKLEDKLAEQVSEISVSWDKEDFNLVVSCELSEGVIAEEILPELKEVIIEQVAKNISSEEVEKQDIFAIKSDDLVEFFLDKGDAEKRAEEIESEDYEVVEGEVTVFVSFDELKSVVVNEKAITSKRKIQSNTVTSTLPPALDTFLQDLAQMKGLFDYRDIIDFSKRATDKDLKELKKLRRQANEAAEYDDEEDLERIAKNVSKIILKSSKKIQSGNGYTPIKSSYKIQSRFYQSAISKYTLSEAAQYMAALFFDLRSIHFLTTGNEFYTYHKLAEELYEKTEDFYDDLIETAIGCDSDISSMYVLPGDWDSVNTDGSFNSTAQVPQTLILDRLEKIYDVLESVKEYDSMVKSKLDAMLEYYDKEIYKLKQALK